MNRFGAELRTDIQAGNTNLLRTEFYQPLTWNRGPFISLSGQYFDTTSILYFDFKPWAEYKVYAKQIRAELGARLGQWGEIRGGIHFGYFTASDIGGFEFDGFSGYRGGFRVQLAFDLEDNPFLPHKGTKGKIQFIAGRPEFGSNEFYDRLDAPFSWANTWGKNTFFCNVEGGSDFGTELDQFSGFSLGGVNRLMGFQDHQLFGHSYSLGQLRWYYKLWGKPSPFSTSWFLLLQAEAGNAWLDTEDARLDNLIYSGSIGLVGTTIFGPLTFAYGQADNGHNAFYVALGSLMDVLN